MNRNPSRTDVETATEIVRSNLNNALSVISVEPLHGDIWATNIMIDDTDPDRPVITAFLDMNA
ncbi:MAG: hypothetical protein ACYTFK_10265 [Planctomycetota bacterium]|jgi:fructosamine-3-kinase